MGKEIKIRNQRRGDRESEGLVVSIMSEHRNKKVNDPERKLETCDMFNFKMFKFKIYLEE